MTFWANLTATLVKRCNSTTFKRRAVTEHLVCLALFGIVFGGSAPTLAPALLLHTHQVSSNAALDSNVKAAEQKDSYVRLCELNMTTGDTASVKIPYSTTDVSRRYSYRSRCISAEAFQLKSIKSIHR